MDEQELIRRCIEKDKPAWDIFVGKYGRLIYWAIHKRLAASSFAYDDGDVQTIFQEVFLSLIEGEKLKQLKDARRIAGWLAMVASHKTVDFMRQKISRDKHFSDTGDAPPVNDENYKQELIANDLVNIVKMVIETFSPKEKIILHLNLFGEKTHVEIAGITAIPVNTVSTIIARAKEKLKTELAKKGIEGYN